MDKWSFNSLLFSKLPDVLDISGAEIARRCGMKQQVFNRYTNNEVVLSVKVLIKICNSLRMPIHFFVSEDNKHDIPNRENATIALDCWQPIGWDHETVERTFGDGGGRIYWKDVAETMGVTEQKPHDRFRLKTRFPVDDFLHTCSVLDISPFRFLIDKNRDCQQKAKRRKATVPAGSPAGDDAAVRADIRALAQKIDGLNATVGELTGKYEDLLRRHTALLDRHNQLERRYNEHFGYDSPFVAADNADNK